MDDLGTITTYPAELTLQYRFEDPSTGERTTLYARDPQLRWTEILAARRSEIVPARYSTEPGTGPMTREWFLDMARQFDVTDNELFKDGLVVCKRIEDFELQVYLQLPTHYDHLEFPWFTPQRLVSLVQSTSKRWHLDAYNRALGILLLEGNKENDSDAMPFDGVYETIGGNTSSTPLDKSAILMRAHLATGHGGRRLTYNRLALQYSWEHMSDDVRALVANCSVCQVRNQPEASLVHEGPSFSVTHIPDTPFTEVSPPITSSLPEGNAVDFEDEI